MKMRSLARALGLSVLLLPGCSDGVGPRGPEPGQLTLTLATPHGDDAALVLTLLSPTGVTLGEIQAAVNGVDAPVLYHRTSGTSTRIAIIGALSDGAVLRVSVPDVNRFADFSAQLVEVADTSNALRESLAGYSVTVTRTP